MEEGETTKNEFSRTFSQLLQDNQFAPLAITLLAQLASIHQILQHLMQPSSKAREPDSPPTRRLEDVGEGWTPSMSDEAATANVDEEISQQSDFKRVTTRQEVRNLGTPPDRPSLISSVATVTGGLDDQKSSGTIDELFKDLV